MKKFYICISLLLFASMQSLFADGHIGGKLTIETKVSAEGKAVIRLDEKANDENNFGAGGDGKLAVDANYNDMVGGKLEMKAGVAADDPKVGLGDNAYVYGHLLYAFAGVDKEMFDVKLQSGRFEVELDQLGDKADGAFLYDIDGLNRDGRVNMQLDLKILDMLTIRYGASLHKLNDSYRKDGKADGEPDKAKSKDMGWSIMFSREFGDHKIMADLAYLVNLDNNKVDSMGDNKGDYAVKTPMDYDQFSFGLGYEGSFGQIKIMPYALLRVDGLLAKPSKYYYKNPMVGWSFGFGFEFKDTTKDFNLIYFGMDIGGETRENNDYDLVTTINGSKVSGTAKAKNYNEMAFKGMAFKIETHGLKALMGKQYLSLYAKSVFELGKYADMGEAKSYDMPLKKIEVGLDQRIVDFEDAAELTLFAKMIAERKKDADSGLNPKFEFGLKGSFTSIFTADVK